MLASIIAVFVIALAGIFLVEALAGSAADQPAPAHEVDVDVDPGATNGQ